MAEVDYGIQVKVSMWGELGAGKSFLLGGCTHRDPGQLHTKPTAMTDGSWESKSCKHPGLCSCECTSLRGPAPCTQQAVKGRWGCWAVVSSHGVVLAWSMANLPVGLGKTALSSGATQTVTHRWDSSWPLCLHLHLLTCRIVLTNYHVVSFIISGS